MGKLQEFLMQSEERAQVTEEVAISGFPVPFTVKSITEGENKALRKTCQKVNFDKKTHQKTTETDMDLYNNRLVIACCVDPNFKDADLQAKYGVMGAEALIDVLLKPGQFVDRDPGRRRLHRRRERPSRRSKKLITGGEREEDADGEAVYAHYALHRLKILPGALMALPLRERAFIYASIDLQVEKEKKEQKRAAARRGKKGR